MDRIVELCVVSCESHRESRFLRFTFKLSIHVGLKMDKLIKESLLGDIGGVCHSTHQSGLILRMMEEKWTGFEELRPFVFLFVLFLL